MPEYSPNVNAPLWSSEQSSPWLPVSEAIRIFDAFAAAAIVESRSILTPPGSCADGAKFFIDGTGLSDWLGHDGELAIAVGSNASNGWKFANIEVEGLVLYVKDDDEQIRFLNGAWSTDVATAIRLTDLLDVNESSLADGFALKYDASNGEFYFAPDLSGIAIPREITATSYDLADADLGRYLRFTASGAKTLNVRTQATHALTLGGEWHIRNGSLSGDITIVPASGVSVAQPAGGTLIIEPGGTATIKSINPNDLDLFGQVTALIS